jgi:tetratricopeptide (TPR) repeat protein
VFAQIRKTPTGNNRSFDLYMRGHSQLEEASPAGSSAALDLCQKAIQVDAGFALAHACAADAAMQLMNYNYLPHHELADEARKHATQAVELDPELAEAHSVLAAVRQMDWDWAGSEASYQQALKLNPEFSRARRWYAGLLAQFGRWDEAIAEAQRALDMDPLDRSAPAPVGYYLFYAGRHEEAINLLKRALADKDMAMTRSNLGEVYAWLGHINSGAKAEEYIRLALEQAAALEKLERASSRDGRTPYADKLHGLIYAAMGDNKRVREYLTRLESDMTKYGTSPVNVAWVYAMVGDTEHALDLLDQAAANRDRKLLYAKVVPFLVKLHGSPRFESLLRLMNLS